jgi:hypothetical protein
MADPGRVDVKDGKGEIIGTGATTTRGTIDGLSGISQYLTVFTVQENGAVCLTDATVIPLAHTAPIYVIVVKQGGAEEEFVLSDTEVTAQGWLHND